MKRQILDHGYVELIEAWGSDERIVESARISTGKGFLGWGPKCEEHDVSYLNGPDGFCCPVDECAKPTGSTKPGDEKLLRFLWEHKHATPFEMAGMTVEIQAPIFVFREWHRHRTQSYNELSARYTPIPDVNYIPTVERLMLNAGDGKNKQAGTVKDAEVLTRKNAELFRLLLVENYAAAQQLYEQALAKGVPKELARVHLPVGRYSRMRASANLRNWLAFLTLRMDQAAQWEIRSYANAVGDLVAKQFPRTWELFAKP